MPAVLEELSKVDPESFLLEIEAGLGALAGYEITAEDVEIRRVEKEGFAASTIQFDGPDGEMDVSIVMDMALTDALLSKGLARDIIRRIQSKRKDLDLDINAAIELEVWLPSNAPDMSDEDQSHVASEVRASSAAFHRVEPGTAISEASDVFALDGEFEISYLVSVS